MMTVTMQKTIFLKMGAKKNICFLLIPNKIIKKRLVAEWTVHNCFVTLKDLNFLSNYVWFFDIILLSKQFFRKNNFGFRWFILKILCETYVRPDSHNIGHLDIRVKNIYLKASIFLETSSKFEINSVFASSAHISDKGCLSTDIKQTITCFRNAFLIMGKSVTFFTVPITEFSEPNYWSSWDSIGRGNSYSCHSVLLV